MRRGRVVHADTHTHTETRVTNIHFASTATHAKCIMMSRRRWDGEGLWTQVSGKRKDGAGTSLQQRLSAGEPPLCRRHADTRQYREQHLLQRQPAEATVHPRRQYDLPTQPLTLYQYGTIELLIAITLGEADDGGPIAYYSEPCSLRSRWPSTPCLKNVPPLACYNFDAREWILIFFWQKCYP